MEKFDALHTLAKNLGAGVRGCVLFTVFPGRNKTANLCVFPDDVGAGARYLRFNSFIGPSGYALFLHPNQLMLVPFKSGYGTSIRDSPSKEILSILNPHNLLNYNIWMRLLEREKCYAGVT